MGKMRFRQGPGQNQNALVEEFAILSDVVKAKAIIPTITTTTTTTKPAGSLSMRDSAFGTTSGEGDEEERQVKVCHRKHCLWSLSNS